MPLKKTRKLGNGFTGFPRFEVPGLKMPVLPAVVESAREPVPLRAKVKAAIRPFKLHND